MTSALISPIAPRRPARQSDVGEPDTWQRDTSQAVASTEGELPAPGPGTGDGDRGGPADASDLRLVARRPSPATFWRRRLVLATGLLLACLMLLGVFGQVGVSAELADRVDGHVIVEPGQTLWDIALVTAPDGVDARAHLAAIEDLNGMRADDVQAWNVILLPAR